MGRERNGKGKEEKREGHSPRTCNLAKCTRIESYLCVC